jgi:hypothetical protein
MINFRQIFKVEVFKTAKLKIFSLILLVPVGITAIAIFLNYNKLAHGFLAGSDFWRYWISNNFLFYAFLLPIIQPIVVSVQMGVEYKNHAFQMLYTLPTKRSYIYFSKLGVNILFILLFLLFSFALMLLSGTVLLQLFPDNGFYDFDLYMRLVPFFAQLFLACVTLGIIHLFISYCNISAQISILIAGFAVIVSLVGSGWRFIHLVPYAWLIRFTNKFQMYETIEWNSKEIYSILFYILLFLVLGLISNHKKQKIN